MRSLIVLSLFLATVGASRTLKQDFLFPIENVTVHLTTVFPRAMNGLNKTLMWSDEFDGLSLNASKWNSSIPTYEYSRKNQQQTYVPENAQVNNGNLEIIASEDENGNITSAWVDTHDKFEFFPNATTSVFLQTRLKLPHPGQGFWPAFWLNPSDHFRYGRSPGSGEIDMMETINSFEVMDPTLHFGSTAEHLMNKSTVKTKGTWADEFHTYSVWWKQTEMTLYVDDQIALHHNSRSVDPDGWYTDFPGAGPNAPFDASFYIIINFAVGGSWPKMSDDTTVFPAVMLVDYVRAYSVE